jgi:hypothetical protein
MKGNRRRLAESEGAGPGAIGVFWERWRLAGVTGVFVLEAILFGELRSFF